MNKNTRIFVAGHRGMVGSAVVRNLDARGYVNVVTRGRSELDLTNQNAVEEFFRTEAIEVVVLAAAKVGGILANDTYPADFLYLNLMIEANVIHAAYRSGCSVWCFSAHRASIRATARSRSRKRTC
jgi:GDP-L-fucose synthase